MIKNLKNLSEGNSISIENEQVIADKKLEIEIWDRDIYQKKRVNMDVAVEIQGLHEEKLKLEDEIRKREGKIGDLEKELLDSQVEAIDFQNELKAKESRIIQLQD